MSATDDIVVGKLTGAYGIRGWVKVWSYTDPQTNLLDYQPWRLQLGNKTRQVKVLNGRPQGKGLVAQLAGVDGRDQAAELNGWEIVINRNQLPEPADDEIYWQDLIGLTVTTIDAVELGKVAEVFATGANDVLVVNGDKARLIPFVIDHVVKTIDLDAGTLSVDWDPEF